MMKMRALKQDLSIYNKFGFERPPIGVKFLLHEPEGIEKMKGTAGLCEMFWKAQESDKPFYITKENEDCAGKLAMGWEDLPPFAEYGQLGEKLDIFQEGRANGRLYDQFYRFKKGLMNYVVFAPLDQLTFEPDLLILTAKPSQAEVLVRAISYSTGDIVESKSTPVLNCSWQLVYPYKSGKINYLVTGLAFGAKSRECFPEGMILVTIPYQKIPEITQNLNEMNWVPKAYTLGREKYIEFDKKVFAEMAQELEEDPQCI